MFFLIKLSVSFSGKDLGVSFFSALNSRMVTGLSLCEHFPSEHKTHPRRASGCMDYVETNKDPERTGPDPQLICIKHDAVKSSQVDWTGLITLESPWNGSGHIPHSA